jgi:hypothetical protein
MKSTAIVSAAVVSVIALGASAANAASIDPSTGDGSLMFFLTDTKTNQTYTDVLTQTVNGYFSASQATTPAPTAGAVNTITGDTGFSYNLSTDSNLTSFLTAASSDTLNWGIIGGTFAGTGASGRPIGAARFTVTDLLSSDVLNVSQGASITGGIPNGLATDINLLNTNLAGGNSTGQGVFGTTTSSGGTTLNSLYGSQINVAGVAPGSSVTLYGVTGNGTKVGTGFAYSLGNASFNLTGDILSFTGNGSAVPLPAAAWLFGSGLLALAGIGRRRAASAV